MGTELSTKSVTKGLIFPEELDMMIKNAELFISSGLCPSRFKNPQQAVIAAAHGSSLGLDFFTSLSEVYIVNNIPSCSAKIQLGRAMDKEPELQFELIEQSDKICRVSMQRKHAKKAQKFQYKIEEAERAGYLSKDNWKKSPVDMLTARAITRMIRSTCMDLVAGFGYTPEELYESKPAIEATKVSKGSGIPKGETVVEAEEVSLEAPLEANQKALSELEAQFKGTDQQGLAEMIHDEFVDSHSDEPETLAEGYELFQAKLTELKGEDK